MSLENELASLNQNIVALVEVIQELVDLGPPGPAEAQKPRVADAKPAKPKAPAKKPDADILDEGVDDPITDDFLDEPETEVVTKEAVRKVLMAITDKHGRQLAIDVLTRQGCAKIGELKESQFADALNQAKAALKTGKA
jgi:hypothetical protein